MLPNKNYTPDDFVRSPASALAATGACCGGPFHCIALLGAAPNVYEAETLLQIVPQTVPDAFVRRPHYSHRRSPRGPESASSEPYPARTNDSRARSICGRPCPSTHARHRRENAGKYHHGSGTAPRNQPADAFYLRFQYGDPAIAARVTERLGTLYVEYNARERGELAQVRINFWKHSSQIRRAD